MSMRLTRLELENIGQWDRLEVDLHARTIIRGQNAAGKSTIIRAIMCLTGASGESAQALVRTDDAGVPVDGAIPQIVGYMEGDGERYKITRRAKKLVVQRMSFEQDANAQVWRTLEPPDKELARIFDRDSSPSALLDERLSDDKRIGLILEVAEAAGYDREIALELALAGASFALQPIPAGLHPLEDLERVIAQVFDARTDVERQRKAAASAAERLATGLTAEAPKDVAFQVEEAEASVKALRETISQLDLKLEIDSSALHDNAQAQIDKIRSKLNSDVMDLREQHRAAASDTQEKLLVGTRNLAELRGLREASIADKARRDESEKARAEAQALAARHAALTRAIQSLKTQAAQFISDSFPGVKVDITEEGKRLLMVNGDNGWKPWKDQNTGRLQEIAAAWSVLHQDKRGAQGVPQLGLVLLDRGESLDPVKIDAIGAAGQLIVTLRTPGELSFEEA